MESQGPLDRARIGDWGVLGNSLIGKHFMVEIYGVKFLKLFSAVPKLLLGIGKAVLSFAMRTMTSA